MSSIYYKNQKYTGPTLDLGSGSLTTDDKTIVGAINELDAEVGAIKRPTIVDKQVTLTSTANTAMYTGVNVSLPAGYFYAFQGRLGYNSAKPLEIWFSSNSGISPESNAYCNCAHNDGFMCTICGYTNASTTFYLWGKWDGADNGTYGAIRGWYQKA